ncbi:MAG: hypothetical protein GIW97_04115 [Candidatus Eremiobacteraeota bacterium]|nr:hypothetical protein [Candidatus Eremiobacteraeota bacterium]
MPLQNRVTPYGDIVALEGRGLMMGNRGILHDDEKRIVRSSQVRRWIACVTEYRGIRREIMRPHSWTQLFFLDEATALSAGHRPCAFCRNKDYKRFCALWKELFGGPVGADIIDDQLHGERLERRRKRTYRSDLATLPDGAYVALDGAPWLVWGNDLLAWSASGYVARESRPKKKDVDVLTPRSIVAVLAAGYCPSIHPSAAKIS